MMWLVPVPKTSWAFCGLLVGSCGLSLDDVVVKPVCKELSFARSSGYCKNEQLLLLDGSSYLVAIQE